ncbi:MAG: PAS domain-containing sensor histidine kinase, partial [Chlamydiota bacterium]
NINILQPEPFHAEHDTYIKNYLKTGIKTLLDTRRETIAIKKTGEPFPIDLFVTEMFIKNQRFFLGIIRDVSERRDSLLAMEKNLRTELELKSKDDFLTMMSHELRTPLHSIMGFTQYLLEELDGPINDLQRGSLNQISISGQHLLGLINGLLELSKIQAHQESVKTEICNLAAILETAIDSLTPLAQQKNLLIKKTITYGHCNIKANNPQIYQIFLNLLSNAIKFTDHGYIMVCLSFDQLKAKITIQDTGIGIDQSQLAKIFIPFEYIFSNLDPKGTSTGLGLAITRKLIEIYNGKLTVTSKKSEGSTLTIELPLSIEPAFSKDT